MQTEENVVVQDFPNKVYTGLEPFINQYAAPTIQCIASLFKSIYLRLTVINLLIFFLKYIPTGLYIHKLIKSVYMTSREKIKLKQIELEDLQLQIEIVNTKLCVRDSEMEERTEQLRRAAERLRRVRARVRHVIASDDALRHSLSAAACERYDDADGDAEEQHSPDEENEFINQLMNELKCDYVAMPNDQGDKNECGENAQTDPNLPDESVYSSLNDADVRKDCHVKIVKVTNVYKVAYLKHYIKQKRQRRATKHALLKKKMESIKKLLEDWQKSLNMVINSKLIMDRKQIDVASQEAMGDYSKPNISSDSESDFRNSEGYYDENMRWPATSCINYQYNYDDSPDTERDCFDSQEFGDIKFNAHAHQCECIRQNSGNILFILPEETTSQVAIEELRSDNDDERYQVAAM